VRVGEVVAHGVEPLAVDGEAGRGDPDRVEGSHQALLIAVRMALKPPSMERTATWYRRFVSMLERVSVSRLTLLPFSRVGSSERWTCGVTAASRPALTALARASSNWTRPARKPGVLTLAMLSAMTRCRMDRASRALFIAVEVTESNTGY